MQIARRGSCSHSAGPINSALYSYLVRRFNISRGIYMRISRGVNEIWQMPKLKALVLDFDSTISTPTFIQRLGQWAVADKVAVFRSMSHDEQIANFGGTERIQALSQLLTELEAAGIALHIISIGHKAAFVPHLEAVGLRRFFDDSRVFGQDSVELREVEFVKAHLISKLMAASGWGHGDLLFVDDSEGHIQKAQAVCSTLLVSAESKSTVGGMAAPELDAIRRAALADP